MKILFLSDVHGITENLDYIRKVEEKENFDKIVVLGDLYYTGPTFPNHKKIESNSVLDFLSTYKEKIIGVRGNCDSDVDIKNSDFPIADSYTLLCVDGLDIYCTHGHLYNKENHKKFNKNGILIYGHEHIPYIIKEDMIYICVGSISLPRNNSKASYAVYEDKIFTIFSTNGDVIDQIHVEE
ncbi:MAG: phosphodiesterase [Bacilli bacterium]|nr:phosphodiesterase [Bacilli bacterium]